MLLYITANFLQASFYAAILAGLISWEQPPLVRLAAGFAFFLMMLFGMRVDSMERKLRDLDHLLEMNLSKYKSDREISEALVADSRLRFRLIFLAVHMVTIPFVTMLILDYKG